MELEQRSFLLAVNENRFTFAVAPNATPAMKKFYDETIKHYKTHMAAFWVVEEVDLAKDRVDFQRMTGAE